MVSADNLNLDVLGLIFAFINAKGDLASIALVSRSFLAGVTPRLYSVLYFTMRQAKRYPKLMTPFATIVAHPHLAVHIRRVEIRCIPTIKSQLHPTFMHECTSALSLASNLRSFRCSLNATPLFLPCLQAKKNLESLRLNANLTTEASKLLIKVMDLTTLAIDHGSWNLLDMLPSWTLSMKSTLTSLTLHNCADVNESILQPTIQGLSALTQLNIIGCPGIDHSHVFRLLHLTPRLESLAFTVTESPCNPDYKPFTLRQLKHLAFDTKYSMLAPLTIPTVSSVLDIINSASSSLTSFTAKLGDRSSASDFLDSLLKTHAFTLRTIAFVGCSVNSECISRICRGCPHLERLDLHIPLEELVVFGNAISHSTSLHTLVDLGDSSHAAHGPRLFLTSDSAGHLMGHARKLTKIVSSGKVWTPKRGPSNAFLAVVPDRVRGDVSEKYWFLPRE